MSLEVSINYKELASKIMGGEFVCEVPNKIWVSTLEYIVSNIQLFVFDSDKIHMLWIVNGGHIRRRVSNDSLVLTWLKFDFTKIRGRRA